LRAARRERILTRSILFGISATLALMLANALVSRDGLLQQNRATSRVIHTHEVLRELDAVTRALSEAEAAQRALVLMNDESYDAPYRAAGQLLVRHIDRARELVLDNPAQIVRARRLAGLAQERLTQMDEVVTTSREVGLMAARQVLARNGNKATSSAIRDLVAEMEADESALLETRLQGVAASYHRAQTLNVLAGALGLLALASFVFFVDRTLRARQLAAQEIARQRELLRVTLVSIGDAVITTDGAARVVFLNREAERLTGWTTAAATGKPLDRIFRIVNEETGAPVENPATRALREGMVVGLANHTILLARDDRRVPIDDSAAPIRDAAGTVSGVVLVFRDVTEERAASQALLELASQLSEADRRKNEFLAILAHELRNPLAAIRSSVAVLRRAEQEPELSAIAMGAIERQMRHLVRLVEDLLDVARISRGKLALQRSRMDLRQALEQAIEASRPLCDEAEQALEVEIPDQPLLVEGDGVRITQAISNILSNACKFSPRGGSIRVSVGIEDSHAIVTIRDTGIGIAADHLPRLFDMFTQVDSGLDRTQGGLGIGLNLVKQLVEMHGGRVEARSEGLGKGSEFVVHFPLLAAADATLPVAAEPGTAGAVTAPAATPARPRRHRWVSAPRRASWPGRSSSRATT
jgi:PAS domain S-box-containing protein